jgi:hypothetical protein
MELWKVPNNNWDLNPTRSHFFSGTTVHFCLKNVQVHRGRMVSGYHAESHLMLYSTARQQLIVYFKRASGSEEEDSFETGP